MVSRRDRVNPNCFCRKIKNLKNVKHGEEIVSKALKLLSLSPKKPLEDQKKLLKRETDSQMMLSDIVNPVDDNFRAKTSEIDSELPDIYQRVTKTEEEII